MIKSALAILGGFLLLFSPGLAQTGEPGDPRSVPVAVAEIGSGVIASDANFTGTVFYPEVSEVAAESNGTIDRVLVEEGQRVNKGEALAELNSDLLEKTIQGTQASYEEALVNLDKARSDLRRMETLYRRQLLSEQAYDENRFRVLSLEKKAASLSAEVERLETELERKTLKSPFEGIVVKRHVHTGGYVQAGSTVATVARDDLVDIVVRVPEPILRATRIGMDVNVAVSEMTLKGKVAAFVPRKDAATRSFPVRVRVPNTCSLVEGMEAQVSFPAIGKKKALLIPRDALFPHAGKTVMYAVTHSKATMIPVNVIGYQGKFAAIEGEGLFEGMKVVIRGNEQLREGQEVTIVPRK